MNAWLPNDAPIIWFKRLLGLCLSAGVCVSLNGLENENLTLLKFSSDCM